MDFLLSDVQRSWRDNGAALGRELTDAATAADVVMGAARVGLLDPNADALAVVVALDALATDRLPRLRRWRFIPPRRSRSLEMPVAMRSFAARSSAP